MQRGSEIPFRFCKTDWCSMDYRAQRVAKCALVVSWSFGEKNAVIYQTHLEGSLEREPLNDMSSIEVLSLKEAAVKLGNSQCVCRSLSVKSK